MESVENKPKLRRSSLELLRIMCMLFIVAHHFGMHGQYGDMEMSQFNSFIIVLLSAGGKLGVNVYILISGYFLVNSKFKLKRVVNTVLITIFYSVAVYAFLVLISPTLQFSGKDLVESIFVIKNNGYWFVTCYVAMVILSPFINKLIHALNQKEHIILIAILVLMQLELPPPSQYFPLSETAWFITLYIIAGYIRKYPNKYFQSKLITGISSLVLCIILGVSKMTAMNNIVCILTSIALFCFFNNLNIKTNRFINLISKTTFAIYLIHDNNFMRAYLWKELLNCPFHAQFNSFWLFSMCAVLLVFCSCMIIELLRMGITELMILPFKKRKSKTELK